MGSKHSSSSTAQRERRNGIADDGSPEKQCRSGSRRHPARGELTADPTDSCGTSSKGADSPAGNSDDGPKANHDNSSSRPVDTSVIPRESDRGCNSFSSFFVQ